jgi:hypothetical protein
VGLAVSLASRRSAADVRAAWLAALRALEERDDPDAELARAVGPDVTRLPIEPSPPHWSEVRTNGQARLVHAPDSAFCDVCGWPVRLGSRERCKAHKDAQ